MFGSIEFYTACKKSKSGVKPLVGAEAYVHLEDARKRLRIQILEPMPFIWCCCARIRLDTEI
jgi:DNA polymerase III alpha subunit